MDRATSNESDGSGALFDFVDQLLEDAESGAIPAIDGYLARFPGLEEEIRKRYGELARRSSGALAIAAIELGPYRIVREIGRGGQGTVYLARDARFARDVALKVLSSPVGAVSDKRRARLRREAEIIARLDHPAICGAIDADLDSATPYIAMRYVEGTTLAEELEIRRAASSPPGRPAAAAREPTTVCRPEGPAQLAETLIFFEKIARALHCAHEAGVVHRDVKPANLRVTPAGEPVILDFGLALDEDASRSALTQTGELFGTLAYMAPEQLASPRVPIDRRADVFALGVTLYETLTLVRPFAARSHESHAPTEPRPLRAANPGLSRELEPVVARALALDADRRYPTCAALADDLANVRLSKPTVARPSTRVSRLVLRARRHPWTAMSLVAAVAASVVAAVLFVEWRSKAAQSSAAAAFMRWRDGDARVDDWQILSRYLPADEESRRVLLGDPRSREARELFMARLESGNRGPGGAAFELCVPRATISESRPRFHALVRLDDQRAWDLVATIEKPGSTAPPVTCRTKTVSGDASVSFDLPPGVSLSEGEWRWTLALDESSHPGDAARMPAGSEVFVVVSAAHVRDVLAGLEPTGDPVLDAELRAVRLVGEGLSNAALAELASLPAVLPPLEEMRRQELFAVAHARGGEPAGVRAAHERWLALQESQPK